MKWILAVAVFVGVMLLTAPAALATAPTGHMVTICHRTGSVAGGNQHNGYSIITVDIASAGYPDGLDTTSGHVAHTQIGNGPGPDLIPAYEYQPAQGDLFTFPGINLDYVFTDGETGAQVLEAGCLFKEASPTPTPSPSETESPTPTPTESSKPPKPPKSPLPPPLAGHNTPPPSPTAFTGFGSTGTTYAGIGLLLAGLGATALRISSRKKI